MVDGEGGCNEIVSSNSNKMKNKEKHTWDLRCDMSKAPCCLVGRVVMVRALRLVMMVVVSRVVLMVELKGYDGGGGGGDRGGDGSGEFKLGDVAMLL